jgi:hypothetical protein
VQALIALQLDLQEAEFVQGDFVDHYVVNDHDGISLVNLEADW